MQYKVFGGIWITGDIYILLLERKLLITFENDLALPSKGEYAYLLRPSSIYLRETFTLIHTHSHVCIRMFTAVFLIVKSPKQPKCPISGTKDKDMVYSCISILDSSDINEL